MPIQAHAAHHPDKPALIFEPSGAVVSYRSLEENAARLANLLRAEGLKRGDHIALLMENHPRFLEVVLAALRSGLYVTAINRYLPGPDAAYILTDCEAQALVASPKLAAVAEEAVRSAPRCRIRLMVDEASGVFSSYERAIAAYPADPPPAAAGDTMLYSSGTTGRPKGIKRALAQGVYGQGANAPPTAAHYGFDAQTVYLSPAPLYHAAPLGFVLATLVQGGSVVVMEKFDPLEALELVDRHKVTHSQWVPTMFVRMLKLTEAERSRYDLSSHRCAIHAAAPCPVGVKQQMIAWWGPILEEYYASTERIGSTRINSAEWLAHPGSVGRAGGEAKIHICDETGRELPIGETGIIYFEQPGLLFTYHNDTDKTASSRHPQHANWATVGDIGRLDEEGYLYLTDRLSFMIISGGVNIYPQAIEDALIMHPAVQDVAVIGVPNAEMGEEVKAVVELRPDVQPAEELARELLDFVRSRVARYAAPRSLDFVDQLPRLPTGKLYKKSLRDRYWPAGGQASLSG
ncbi:acyl-CoA synthetase [Phenylobacterium sp.]|uniref:acyl-CoA synthetase n=1 Tax=Phenylobacterium sp. TaxID=1871053 RepID=UPI00301D1B2E